MNALTDSRVSRIRKQIKDHPHFRGRSHLLHIEANGGSIVVSGRLPNYYLKQLVQEAIKTVPEIAHIDNCVNVTF